MLAVNSAVSFATWIPYAIWLALGGSSFVGNKDPNTRYEYLIFTSLPILNSFVTPVIYFIFNNDFRVSVIFY